MIRGNNTSRLISPVERFRTCFLPRKKQTVTFSQSSISFHRVVGNWHQFPPRFGRKKGSSRFVNRRRNNAIEFSSICRKPDSPLRFVSIIRRESVKLVKSGSMLDKRSLFVSNEKNLIADGHDTRGGGGGIT